MDWNVVFAIVALAAIFQLAFFWYYLRAGDRRESVYPNATGESGESSSVSGAKRGHSRHLDDDDTIVTCQECGYDNKWESVFTYCANCASKIGR